MPTHILICDDSSLARKQMARALPPGLADDILFAGSGEEALPLVGNGQVDLLFLDLNMPGMDGYQVLQQIQKEDLPVLTIVVSGDIQPEARERVRKLGAIDFIKKPTDTGAVAQLLEEYGFYRPGDLENVAMDDGSLHNHETVVPEISVTLNDYLQEISNVAMGRSSDLLARLLKVFVKQPIPKVAFIANSELHTAEYSSSRSATENTLPCARGSPAPAWLAKPCSCLKMPVFGKWPSFCITTHWKAKRCMWKC